MQKNFKRYKDEISKEEALIRLLKKGIWLYIFLLIFEGALRKWFLPFLATPLLIVRDPLAIWLIYKCWKHNLMPYSLYLLGMSFIGLFCSITTFIFGHGNLTVVIFGARILLFHFPIMFVIGKLFSRDDVIQVGKILLWITVPMVILIGLQFYSSQSAWVNRGIGGDMEGSGFSGAMGYFRPSGTFSFTNGNVMFFSLVACYVFYFWSSKEKVNRILLIAATIGLMASISFSISRSLLFSIILTLVFTIIAASRKPEYLPKLFGAIVVVAILLAVLSQTSFFKTGTEVFTARFETASKSEGNISSTLVDRFLGGMISAITDSQDLPFFGRGIGIGTKVGSKYLAGSTSYLAPEGEWGRLVTELGLLFGVLVILIRIAFSTDISIKSYLLLKKGDFLPWILLSFGLLVLVQGQWAQATSLGFSTLIGGLILASSKQVNLEVND